MALENAYSAILAGPLGTVRHPDLGWCASAYVLHVADNLRIHGERMAASTRGAKFTFEGSDQDELAMVRKYELIPIEGALWSLGSVATSYVAAFHDADQKGVVLPHIARGQQRAVDVLRGNVHDAHHHGLGFATHCKLKLTLRQRRHCAICSTSNRSIRTMIQFIAGRTRALSNK